MRGLSQFHENDRLIQWIQTSGGKLALWLIATALLLPSHRSILVPLFLGLTMIWPKRRQLLVLIAAPLVGLELMGGSFWDLPHDPGRFPKLVSAIPAVVTVLLLVLLSIAAAKNFERLPAFVRRHPVLTLHLLVCGLIILTWPVFPEGADRIYWMRLGTVFGLLPFLVWRCCYIMLSGQRGSAKESSYADHLFYALPVFGGTNVPYGKGYDYLRRCWAADPQALARSQLAGLKLLFLYWLWLGARRLIEALAHGDYQHWPSAAKDYGIADSFKLNIPELDDLVAMSTSLPPSLADAWSSLFLGLIVAALSIAILGHGIIGSLRLFGFNVFRNTYKPLLAESIVEFWNRFYYYFKELLVEFFFYPVYARYFRNHQRLRVFAAVFAAACLGNIYYHVLRDIWKLHDLSMADALASVGPRSFYMVLLATGIYFSMMAQTRKRDTALPVDASWLEPLHRVRRIAGVWLFYALIRIWNVSSPDADFGTRTAFFFSLFGLDVHF